MEIKGDLANIKMLFLIAVDMWDSIFHSKIVLEYGFVGSIFSIVGT